MGDFNINLFNYDKHLFTSEFVDLMFSFSYSPLINKPTRVKNNSYTLIDNIYCNDVLKNDIAFNGILFSDITDHFPIFSINNKNIKSVSQRQYFLKRLYNHINIYKFSNKLQNIDLSNVLHCNKAQESFSLFYKEFTQNFEECFPITKVKINYRNRKPWS